MQRLVLVFCAALLAPSALRADERIGPEILVVDLPIGNIRGGPVATSDGLNVFIAWQTDAKVFGARIDGAGNVDGPFVLSPAAGANGDLGIASNGRGALVAWAELPYQQDARVNVALMDVDGRPLQAQSFMIDRGGGITPANVRVGFDGVHYRVLWQRARRGYNASEPRTYTRRIGPDASAWSKKLPVKVRNMTRYPYEANLACLTDGQCLVTWQFSTGADIVQGVRVAGDAVIDNEVINLMDKAHYHDVVAGDDQYLVVALQPHRGCGQPQCPVTVAAARVDSDGNALDPNGITIDNPIPGVIPYAAAVRADFDGENYLVNFMSEPAFSVGQLCGWNSYGARVTPDGAVINPDIPGSVISDANRVKDIDIASTRTAAVAVWADQRDGFHCYETPSLRVQVAFPHTPATSLPLRNIGSIGTQSVAEQQTLRFTVGTPGLDPATTTIAVTNAPEGALFDEATRTFQWVVYPNQSGTYGGIHFEASDASQTISEDVTINVAEGSLAICGYVDDLSGGTVPNVALRLKGGGGKPRTVTSDADGRFCFFQVVQGAYRLTLDRESSRDFVRVRQTVIVNDGDVRNVAVPARPR